MSYGNVVFEPESELAEDISLGLRTLLSARSGTCPLERDFGIDREITDKPPDVAMNLYSVDIIEKIAKYEPRVTVTEVTFDMSEGCLIPHVHVALAGGESDE